MIDPSSRSSSVRLPTTPSSTDSSPISSSSSLSSRTYERSSKSETSIKTKDCALSKFENNEMKLIADFLKAEGMESDIQRGANHLTTVLKSQIDLKRTGSNWFERAVNKIVSIFTGAPATEITYQELAAKVAAFTEGRLATTVQGYSSATSTDRAANTIILTTTLSSQHAQIKKVAAMCLEGLTPLAEKEREKTYALKGKITDLPTSSTTTKTNAFFDSTWRK